MTSTPSNTSGMNWNVNCNPDLVSHHQGWTSLMLLSPNGSKSLDQIQNLVEKFSQQSGRLLQQQINARNFAMRCPNNHIFATYFWPCSVVISNRRCLINGNVLSNTFNGKTLKMDVNYIRLTLIFESENTSKKQHFKTLGNH